MRISDWSSDVCSSDLHAQDPPFAIEVIGICAAEGDRERAVHVANREAEGASLYPVDHDPQLRRVFLPLRPNAGKARALHRGGQQPVAGRDQRVSTVAAHILQLAEIRRECCGERVWNYM